MSIEIMCSWDPDSGYALSAEAVEVFKRFASMEGVINVIELDGKFYMVYSEKWSFQAEIAKAVREILKNG
jgi:hypothetical protein